MRMSLEWQADCQHWRGRVLTGEHGHWCFEWDGLPIDETCPEWPCCDVAYQAMPRKVKKFAKACTVEGRLGSKRRRHLLLRLARVTTQEWRRCDAPTSDL